MHALLKHSLLAVLILIALDSQAQFNTVTYVSHGYFNGMDFSEKAMIEASFVIAIDQNLVKITKLDLSNRENDELIYESRMLSALKYPTIDGDQYYVWKLGDRKMVLRKLDGKTYISLYQTDEYGLPKEYTTYLIKQ